MKLDSFHHQSQPIQVTNSSWNGYNYYLHKERLYCGIKVLTTPSLLQCYWSSLHALTLTDTPSQGFCFLGIV